ncbi:MAG: UPF0182 family protein [Armatimonadota bacterium]
MGIVSADFGRRRLRRRVARWAVLLVLFFLVFWWLPGLLRLYTDWLWFRFDVRYPTVFWTVLTTKLLLGIAFGALFFVLVMGNVELARRLARRTLWYDEERALRQRIAEVMEYLANRYLYLALAVVALVVAYGVGVGAAQQWNKYLLFRQGAQFGLSDPVFNRDVGFYVFRLPFWQYLQSFGYGVLIAVFILSAAAHYFDKAIRLLRGVPAFAPHVKAHLSVLLGLILVLKAFGYRLAAFNLLFSSRGVTFGASYTDVHAELVAYNVLLVIALACAALVLINVRFRGLWLPIAGIGFLALSSLLLSAIYPAIVQRFQVVPNEFEREKPFIEHTIAFTRRGFDLDRIDQRTLTQVRPLTMATVRENVETIDNLRLWDYRPLLATFEQQQALWTAYTFNSVDIDRYWIDGRYRQVMLAARELSTPDLPNKGWQNDHIYNTHGYGIVMAPVSDAIQSGLPNLVVRNIPVESSFDLNIARPGIYYGELTNEYVIVGTREDENDYPLIAQGQSAPEQGKGASAEALSGMAKTRYQGRGGVPIGSLLPRLAASVRFSDLNLVISNLITKDSRVLWRRNVVERAQTIAPFLSYDRDPYIVAAKDGHLYWIHDAYTTTDMYPYSQRVPSGEFNYVRNSVKVVTDAYDGSVTYYVADETDQIVNAYRRLFPSIFRPIAEMPSDLRQHVRYPEALFNTQSAMLLTYHMTDPRAFYNKADKWDIAREMPKSVGPAQTAYSGGGSQGEMMQAYYAILRLPQAKEPEFLLILPFTPQAKPNMVAWLAGRSDGAEYGRMLLYYFPKSEQVWGPMQIEASINQATEISEKKSLWNQQGSQMIQGNLLVIPMDSSFLYVEPVYLKASEGPIPELKRVVLAKGDGTVVMRPTVSEALAAMFGQQPPQLTMLEATGLAAEPETPTPAAAPPATGAQNVRELVDAANTQLREVRDRLDQLEQTIKRLGETK